MKNLKPIVFGSLAGAGLMFVALQYHVVQSHDGLQLVPRAPRASLGLAYADVREWRADEWSDRPELARALVAHGGSDLIADSVKREIADNLDADGGTIGQLRTLLNDSLTSSLEEPFFSSDDEIGRGSSGDRSPTIPFPRETRHNDRTQPLADRSHEDVFRTSVADRSDDLFYNGETSDSGFDGFHELSLEETSTGPVSMDGLSGSVRPAPGDPFSKSDSFSNRSRRQEPSRESGEERRRRESSQMEDLLFSDDAEETDDWTNTTGNDSDSGFGTVTRALDSRASQALQRARQGLGQSLETARRDPSDQTFGRSESAGGTTRVLPRAIEALRDGFDPFLQ